MTTLNEANPSRSALPVLDISRFHGREREAFVAELRHVLHDHGFFYLTGHGVEQAFIDDVIAASKKVLRASNGREAEDRDDQVTAF